MPAADRTNSNSGRAWKGSLQLPFHVLQNMDQIPDGFSLFQPVSQMVHQPEIADFLRNQAVDHAGAGVFQIVDHDLDELFADLKR